MRGKLTLILFTFTAARITIEGVNKVDFQGKQCVASLRLVPCSPVCVQSVGQCPLSIQPDTCSLNYCKDGSCRKDCSSVSPSCLCRPDLVPCKSFYANVSGFQSSAQSGNSNLINACAKTSGVPLTSTMPFLLQCPPILQQPLSSTSLEFLIFYLVLSAECLLLFIHSVSKLYRYFYLT